MRYTARYAQRLEHRALETMRPQKTRPTCDVTARLYLNLGHLSTSPCGPHSRLKKRSQNLSLRTNVHVVCAGRSCQRTTPEVARSISFSSCFWDPVLIIRHPKQPGVNCDPLCLRRLAKLYLFISLSQLWSTLFICRLMRVVFYWHVAVISCWYEGLK